MGGGSAADGVITLLVAPGALDLSMVELDPSEAHHLNVRRGGEATRVRLVDGQGRVAAGMIEPAGKRVQVRVEEVDTVPPPPALTLAVAAGDRDRFAAMIDAAAQLGATGIVPVETERSVTVATRVRAEHRERLTRRAREAIKQCGSAWAPLVSEPIPLATYLAAETAAVCWLAESGGAAPPARLSPAAVAVLVGPEGGLTEREIAAARAAEFLPVALGPNILRFESAATAAAACVATARMRGAHG